MIASRREPRPTRRSGEIQVPAPSGPRCASASRIRVMYGSWTSNAPQESAPAMPHTLGRCHRLADEGGEDGGSALARPPVPQGDRGARTAFLDERGDLRDPGGVEAYDGVRSKLDGDRPLGAVAQREARDAERGRFLLHAARVRQHKPRLRLEAEEVK